MAYDGACHSLCLDGIGRCPTAVKYRLRQMMKHETHIGACVVGAWHDEKPIVIELLIGNGNQRMMLAAVVPSQHTLWQAAARAKVKNTFYVMLSDSIVVVILLFFTDIV